jgi:hypothetical protein
MNKKVLYGVILLSIFLMSAATSVQPVQGYKFGVPDQAKGVEGESEIKVFDEDQWESCFGQGHGADEVDDIYDGDVDVVGAKSKSIVKDWEKDDEIEFFWDFVLEADLSLPMFEDFTKDWYAQRDDPNVDSYKDSINYINDVISNKITTMLGLLNATVWYLNATNPGNPYYTAYAAAAAAALIKFAQGTITETQAKALFSPEYEGTMVTLDTWDYYEGAYPDKPDDKDADAPFLSDPEDLYDSYETLVDMKTYLYTQLVGGATPQPTTPGSLFYQGLVLNGTIAPGTSEYTALDGAIITNSGGKLNLRAILDNTYGAPMLIQEFFEKLIPKAGGYLYLALTGGLPVYTPTGKFLANMVEEFEDDIEDSEDTPETGHPDMDGSIPYEVSVDVDKEAMTITIEFEMDDYIDPAYYSPDPNGGTEIDDPDEMEDWEVTFYYGEYGSQSKIEYKHGDDIFFSKESLAIIPGFEITIILGASAVAILGLIYVVMKKRKM